MPALILRNADVGLDVRIPEWVADLASFRRWADSDEFPEGVRIDYFDGEIWVDASMEQIFWHNQVKTEFTVVLGGLVKTRRLGRYFTDGLRVSHVDADLSAEPDGTFVSAKGLRERVRVVEGAEGGYVELEGSPEMVLEIISDSSVTKDTKRLRKKYWDAEVREYWLADVRGERLDFDIFRHTPNGYVATPKRGGWLKSNVFGKSFRLTRQVDSLGHPEFTVEVR